MRHQSVLKQTDEQQYEKVLRAKQQSLLQRFAGNPILSPQDIPGANQVYNAAAIRFDGETLLLCTIVTDEPLPRLHLARSPDGKRFSVENEPFITAAPGESWLCDPRITFMDGNYYIFHWSGSSYGVRSVLSVTRDFRSVECLGYVCEPDNRNMVLFPEKFNGLYARLDRPYGQSHEGSIWISYSPDLVFWGQSQPVADKGDMFQWEGKKIGPSVPPIRTDRGWLIIYHGVRGGYPGYYLGAMLLALEDPSQVIGRMKSSILSPREDYERLGAVPNVVFSCGATEEADGQLNIYYSGADTCVCLATAGKDELAARCLAEV
jgi:predicted GH43/DUF377 family glycosyl hydrolase